MPRHQEACDDAINEGNQTVITQKALLVPVRLGETASFNAVKSLGVFREYASNADFGHGHE